MKTHILPKFLPPALRDAVREIDLAKGERLFCMGAPVESVFFVLKGRLKAVRCSDQGVQTIMLQAAAGEFFAESALAAERYVCDAFATQASRVAAIPAPLLLAQLRAGGPFATAFALCMASSARRQCSRYERLRLKRARERVLHLVRCEGGAEGRFPLQIPLVELAEELALEPETLYRVLRELSEQGIILRTRSEIRLIAET